MILFKQTVPATLENVRWLRKNLGRKLEDSCLRAIDPKLYDRRLTLSLIDSILLAVTEIANNVVQHASPKPSFMALEVRLVGAALRLEFTNDGGAFTGFEKVLQSAGRVRHSADFISGRGLSLVSQALQDLEYQPGNPNRLVGWRKLRRARPHILIVVNNTEDSRQLRTMLSQNYSTSCVRSASEAQLILSSQRIDVILADYDLLLHQENIFKVAFDESPIPLVMMASPDQLDEVRRHPSNIDQCLPKPVSTSALIAAVEIAIASYTRRLIHLANFFGRSAGVLLADELPPAFPGFKLAVLSGTASYGGGDFGLTLRGKGFTRLVLADIMGHGLKAKAGAIALSSIIRTLHCQVNQPADVLLQNASHIIGNEPAFTDIISTIIVVDAAEDGWIEAACAGHPPVAIVSPEGSFILPVTGPLPGLLPKPFYNVASHQLRPGDKIAIVTDGIDSQTSATADFPERLLKQLTKDPERSLVHLKSDMEEWLARRLGPAPKDDWTLMIGEYCGDPAPASRTLREAREALLLPSNW
jgi:serine/threonine-protein kinase RsbW